MNRIKIILAALLLGSTVSYAGVVANKKGKCGYEDENGKLIIDYKYDFIGNFDEHGLARIKSGSKYGLIDRSGKIVLPVSYDNIGIFRHGVANLTQGKKVGLLSVDGKILLKPTYKDISHFNSDGLAMAEINPKNKNYAIINLKGEVVIPSIFDYSFKQVTPEGEFTSIDFGNDTLDSRGGYFQFIDVKGYIYYNIKGEEVLNNDKYNELYQKLLNTKFKKATSTPFGGAWHGVQSIHEDVAVLHLSALTDKKTYTFVVAYYDLKKGRLMTSYSFTGAKADLEAKATVEEMQALKDALNLTEMTNLNKSNAALWGNFYKTGLVGTRIAKLPQACSAEPFHEGYGVIHQIKGGVRMSVLINNLGQEVGQYVHLQPYHNGYAVIANAQKLYGLIDSNQKNTVPCQYKAISNSSLKGVNAVGYLGVQDAEGHWGVIQGADNSVVVPFEYDYVGTTYSDVCFVGKDKQYGAYQGSTLELECTLDSLNWTINSSVLGFKDGHYFVYYFDEKRYSPLYDGRGTGYLASDEYHGGGCYLVKKMDNNTCYYGFVNALAEEMLPAVFQSEGAAFKALEVYKNQPLQVFEGIELYRLPLQFSTRERTYQLTDIVPQTDWDF